MNLKVQLDCLLEMNKKTKNVKRPVCVQRTGRKTKNYNSKFKTFFLIFSFEFWLCVLRFYFFATQNIR
jgi:hypothetical protein